MKKILLMLFVIVFCGSAFSQMQTTVTFKPDSIIGKDAPIFTTGSCITQGNTLPCAEINYGNNKDIMTSAWTYRAIGCPRGTKRSLLKFEELSTIPANAQIVSAELKLFGVPYNVNYPNGNSSFPGAPNGFYSNQSFIQRVTSPWDEQTVTWNTQPATTAANQITIPPSTSQWHWNFSTNSDNLVAMVQDMVANPATNFGFMLRLETEEIYRSLIFASSDNDDKELWPELTVSYKYCPGDTIIIHDTTYIQLPCPCEANFSYLVNTVNPDSYYFTASNSAQGHHWTIDGIGVSNAGSFVYNFTPGTHRICYVRELESGKCEKCITICVERSVQDDEEEKDLDTTESDNFPELKEKNPEEEVKPAVPQGELPPGDIIFFDDNKTGIPQNSTIEIYPNPTTNDWTVKILAEKEEAVKIQLSDIQGRALYSDNKYLTAGNNSFVITVNNLMSGSYFLQIIGNTIQFSKMLLKE